MRNWKMQRDDLFLDSANAQKTQNLMQKIRHCEILRMQNLKLPTPLIPLRKGGGIFGNFLRKGGKIYSSLRVSEASVAIHNFCDSKK
ncbi:hypothetical protein ACWIUD_01655 [Helicobacter sp. 23-1044]